MTTDQLKVSTLDRAIAIVSTEQELENAHKDLSLLEKDQAAGGSKTSDSKGQTLEQRIARLETKIFNLSTEVTSFDRLRGRFSSDIRARNELKDAQRSSATLQNPQNSRAQKHDKKLNAILQEVRTVEQTAGKRRKITATVKQQAHLLGDIATAVSQGREDLILQRARGNEERPVGAAEIRRDRDRMSDAFSCHASLLKSMHEETQVVEKLTRELKALQDKLSATETTLENREINFRNHVRNHHRVEFTSEELKQWNEDKTLNQYATRRHKLVAAFDKVDASLPFSKSPHSAANCKVLSLKHRKLVELEIIKVRFQTAIEKKKKQLAAANENLNAIRTLRDKDFATLLDHYPTEEHKASVFQQKLQNDPFLRHRLLQRRQILANLPNSVINEDTPLRDLYTDADDDTSRTTVLDADRTLDEDGKPMFFKFSEEADPDTSNDGSITPRYGNDGGDTQQMSQVRERPVFQMPPQPEGMDIIDYYNTDAYQQAMAEHEQNLQQYNQATQQLFTPDVDLVIERHPTMLASAKEEETNARIREIANLKLQLAEQKKLNDTAAVHLTDLLAKEKAAEALRLELAVSEEEKNTLTQSLITKEEQLAETREALAEKSTIVTELVARDNLLSQEPTSRVELSREEQTARDAIMQNFQSRLAFIKAEAKHNAEVASEQATSYAKRFLASMVNRLVGQPTKIAHVITLTDEEDTYEAEDFNPMGA